MFKRITSLLAIFLTLALLAGACGSDSADSSSSGSCLLYTSDAADE